MFAIPQAFFVILAWSCTSLLAESVVGSGAPQSLQSSHVSVPSTGENQSRSATLHQQRRLRQQRQQSTSLLQIGLHTAIQPQPRAEGHFLTNQELRNVDSISCLEKKQRDPLADCVNWNVTQVVEPVLYPSGPVTLGHYPNWQDTRCSSHGEFFCDPTGILTNTERQQIAELLKRSRYESHVTCGGIELGNHNEYNSNSTPFRTTDYHYQPFYLGVAMIDGLSPGDIDFESLKVFGQSIAAQWNMDNLFIGSPRPYAMCPNVAMLVVIPDRRQIYLSSQSCEFICQDRGGLKVTQVALSALDGHGPADAVKKGIEQVYSILGVNHPMHGPLNVVPVHQDETASYGNGNMDNYGTLLLRIVFVLSILVVIFSACIAFGVCLLAPGYIKHLGKRP